jgi:hypothetical protein
LLAGLIEGFSDAMTSRLDPVRSTLAAIAAVFAIMGAVASNADHGMIGWEFGTRVFPVEAVIAAAFAVVPSAGSWSRRRRTLAAGMAGLSSLASLWLLAVGAIRVGCSCAYSGSPDIDQLPTIAGIAAGDWLAAAALAIPVLMLLSGLGFPDHVRPEARNQSAKQ